MPLYPRTFFDKFVVRSFQEFIDRPADEYRAHHAVQDLNILVEWYWHYWSSRQPALVSGYIDPRTGAGDFRTHIQDKLCPEFGIIRDVAEAHKHVELRRRNPPLQVPTATHTSLVSLPMTWWSTATGLPLTFLGVGSPIAWAAQELRVNLTDGSTVPLLPAVQKTHEFLKDLIAKQPPRQP